MKVRAAAPLDPDHNSDEMPRLTDRLRDAAVRALDSSRDLAEYARAAVEAATGGERAPARGAPVRRR